MKTLTGLSLFPSLPPAHSPPLPPVAQPPTAAQAAGAQLKIKE